MAPIPWAKLIVDASSNAQVNFLYQCNNKQNAINDQLSAINLSSLQFLIIQEVQQGYSSECV